MGIGAGVLSGGTDINIFRRDRALAILRGLLRLLGEMETRRLRLSCPGPCPCCKALHAPFAFFAKARIEAGDVRYPTTQ